MISVKDCGASGDGLTDDTSAFEKARDLATVNKKGDLFVPSGCYRLTRPLIIQDTSIKICDVSPQNSFIFFENCDGFQYKSITNPFTYALNIENLSIISVGSHNHTGISAKFPSNVGSPGKNCVIREVTLAGSESISKYIDSSNDDQTASSGWNVAIYLEHCAASSSQDVLIRGGNVGIKIKGYTVDFIAQRCRFFYVDTAIEKHAPGEGLLVDSCIAINVGHFVYFNPGATSRAGVFAQVRGSHARYSAHAVIGFHQDQIFVVNNVFYPMGSASTDVSLYFCNRSIISGNVFVVNQDWTVPHQGVVLNDCKDVVVQGNIIQERDAAIWIKGASSIYTNMIKSSNIFGGNRSDVVV